MHHGCMASPPEAHNTARGDLYGTLVQARDIHGGVTVHLPRDTSPIVDVSLDPPRLTTAVRGRSDLLSRLREAMERGSSLPHVLTGPGGFGKTTVAAALAEYARDRGWTVFWVRADAITPSMLEIAVELAAAPEEIDRLKSAPKAAARWVWRRLDRSSTPWLLVVDDADRPEEPAPDQRPGERLGWMRSSPKGFVLVTSRLDDAGLWAPAEMLRVGPLNVEDASAALTEHARVPGLSGADTLAERLGGVPLALALAGRVLATHGVLFPDARSLLEHLDENITGIDALAGPVSPGPVDERRMLSGVWELSLRLVGERHPRAVPLLRALSLLGARGRAVPLWRAPRFGMSDVSFARTVNALVVHGLVGVERTDERTSLLLHPLISETVRAGLGENDAPLVSEVERLLEEQGERDPWFELDALTSLASVAGRAPALGSGFRVRVGLGAAHARIRLGRFEDAERTATAALRTAEGAFGADHPLTLRSRHLLAESLLFQDRVEEAERSYLALLADRERVLGADHPRTLDTRHQIALVAGARGEWRKARALHERVLEARLREQGAEADETLASMDALGYAALRLDDLDTAERLFDRVHEVRLRLLGGGELLTLNADYKRGLVALRRGHRPRAREIFHRVMEGRARILGRDHPQTRLARDRMSESFVDPGREFRGSGASG